MAKNVQCTVYDIHCVQVFSECTRMYNFTKFSDTFCTKCK